MRNEANDPFDPNTWEIEENEYRIYASNDPEFYVVVDQADYAFLAQFSWSIHSYRVDARYPRIQLYLRRSISDFYDRDGEPYISPIHGYLVRNRRRVQRNLFLHFVVLLRKQADERCNPESPQHHIADHADRNTRNCRRSNLQWATPSHSTANQVRHVNKPKPKRNKKRSKRR